MVGCWGCRSIQLEGDSPSVDRKGTALWTRSSNCCARTLLGADTPPSRAFFPLEVRLEGSQPQISQYETLSSDVRDQEPHLPLFLVSDYTEINVSGNTSYFVLRVIDIEQLLWFVQ